MTEALAKGMYKSLIWQADNPKQMSLAGLGLANEVEGGAVRSNRLSMRKTITKTLELRRRIIELNLRQQSEANFNEIPTGANPKSSEFSAQALNERRWGQKDVKHASTCVEQVQSAELD